MTEIPGFAINAVPRTKKTSNIAVTIRPKDGRRPFQTVLPSAAYQKFFRAAMKESPLIKAGLRQAGVELPIQGDLNVCALFYRDRDQGDAVGFYQALGDFLQSPREKNGKETRQGAGLIVDDRQVKSWNGSELRLDYKHPRIEVFITVLRERATTLAMFAAEEKEEEEF